MSQTTERAFETYVEEILLTLGGVKAGSNAEWDKEPTLSEFRALCVPCLGRVEFANADPHRAVSRRFRCGTFG